MFGFVIGTICLIGFARMWRRHRYGRGYGFGWHHGWHHHHGRGHHHGWHGDDGYERGYERGFGRGFGPVDFVLRRLEASPEQARVIRGEVEDLYEKAREMRREWRLSRDDVAKAMRAEGFDAEVMGESFARHDEELAELRKTFVGALANIHEVLDERQRRRLADIIETGPQFRGYRPYR